MNIAENDSEIKSDVQIKMCVASKLKKAGWIFLKGMRPFFWDLSGLKYDISIILEANKNTSFLILSI